MAWEAGGERYSGGPHADLVEQWVAALTRGTRDHVVPMSRAETRTLLTRFARELDAAARDPASDRRIAELGAELARAHFVGDEVLGRSVAVLEEYFAEIADDVPADRVAMLLAAFTTGYVRAFRAWLLAEQESVRVADITARRLVEQRLRESEARFRAVFAQAGIGTGLSDMTGRIIEVNTAFAQMLGYTPAEMLRLSVTDLGHPSDDPGMWQLYSGVLRGDLDNVQLEKCYPHKDGHGVWTNINVSLIRDERGEPQYTLILVEDISERRALRERLHYRANHDQLTGLANRTRFFDALTTVFADPGVRVGLCYVDLDHFKTVNDTFGHAVGDELLAQAATRLTTCATGPGQLVARMGGDEFVILVPHSGGADEVASLARCVLNAFSRPFHVHGYRLSVTASVGVMEDRAGHTTAEELLRSADSSMYWAKAAGRGRYEIFDAARSHREHTRVELTAAMPDALARGEFFLDYQPIVALDGSGMVAVEALARWRHPELGILPPARFVDLAEDNGHIGALGSLVLNLAIADSRAWSERYPALTPLVSVNVSATEVSDPAWLDLVQQAIADSGLKPEQLQLELTERAFMATTGRPLHALRTLAESGVRIAVDDFGTGYSNLAYLGRLPLHTVKLAGPFVRHLRTPDAMEAADLRILETIIALAHDLGYTVTAECVETRHQADQLRALGCDTAQGWYFHHPMPAARITDLLAEAEEAAAHQL
ncbi:putative bifunctional diguanylate cyclase/phosphodiesterase [Nocardia otitidiscaviarum]|uniref:putative bifunctional diguanylate cyclase/phosphodiesterase n=1 Tax=Nocardia otitidiscaviarum TaxID=1823 RepID=UPI00189361C1|nr:bifunctional diguanylate cyclase/phosphodiesterase [Nocardia otitidiscaviarum]MBF6181620.1 EAL domain-containing protein [Nocardia otitidiscaviarum]